MLYYNITGVHAGPGTASRSRGRYARALLRFRALKGGRGEGRVRAAPAVSRASCAQEIAHEHTGSAGAFRPSLRNGFTAYGALSPVNGLFCHRRPCEALASQELDASIAAPGPHAFAVRNSHARQSRQSRPPHPTARFVTIAIRPSCRVRRASYGLIWVRTKGEYFCGGGWTKGWRDLPDGWHRGGGWRARPAGMAEMLTNVAEES